MNIDFGIKPNLFAQSEFAPTHHVRCMCNNAEDTEIAFRASLSA